MAEPDCIAEDGPCSQSEEQCVVDRRSERTQRKSIANTQFTKHQTDGHRSASIDKWEFAAFDSVSESMVRFESVAMGPTQRIL